jgi:5-methylcytosine-specific restriction endonuclease McrA
VSTRAEFSDKTKLAEWQAAGGKCRDCSVKLRPGMPREYHHIIPANVGGGNESANCLLLCKPCHSKRTTTTDTPQAARTKRLQKQNAGIKKKRKGKPIPGSTASGWKHKMDGSWERR